VADYVPCAGLFDEWDACSQGDFGGGAGGAGGGGGEGGTGGTPAGLNCDTGECTDGSTQKAACETQLGICEAIYPNNAAARNACFTAANADACGT
jgi:hypothetical protein